MTPIFLIFLKYSIAFHKISAINRIYSIQRTNCSLFFICFFFRLVFDYLSYLCCFKPLMFKSILLLSKLCLYMLLSIPQSFAPSKVIIRSEHRAIKWLFSCIFPLHVLSWTDRLTQSLSLLQHNRIRRLKKFYLSLSLTHNSNFFFLIRCSYNCKWIDSKVNPFFMCFVQHCNGLFTFHSTLEKVFAINFNPLYIKWSNGSIYWSFWVNMWRN